MSDLDWEFRQLADAYVDHLYAVFDDDTAQRIMLNDVDAEDHLNLYLDYAERGGIIDEDVAAYAWKNPHLVLEKIGA